MIDVIEIKRLISAGDVQGLAHVIKRFGLILDGTTVKATDDKVKRAVEYWDKKQQVRKICLNSEYGSGLSPSSRFADHRIGQSITLSGRVITKNMTATINEQLTGEYSHTGDAIVYGDSVTGDTIIRTTGGDKTIAELFDECQYHTTNGEKEYGFEIGDSVIGYNSNTKRPVLSGVAYVMRHKTKKRLYKVTLSNGKTVTVTEDHSLMVERSGTLVEVKPTQVLPSDIFLSLKL